MARNHERIIFLKNNIITEWNSKKPSKESFSRSKHRTQANTLIPRDFHTEKMMETTQIEMTDGRLTADVNEVYPEGGTIVNSSL